MDVPPILNSPSSNQPASTGKPKPHGCLASWLALMLLYYALITGLNLLGLLFKDFLQSKSGPSEATWITVSAVVLNGLCLFSTLFIFLRKRWAFYAVVLFSGVMLVVLMIAGKSLFDSLTTALPFPVILYGVLQIGGENSWWKQMK